MTAYNDGWNAALALAARKLELFGTGTNDERLMLRVAEYLRSPQLKRGDWPPKPLTNKE